MAREILVLVTCAAADSMTIADCLVDEGLVACVNILPGVKSIYLWQGQKCLESEELLLMKSHQAIFPQLCARVKELHSYDVPEIIQLPIEDGYQPYLQWLNASLRYEKSGCSEAGI